MTNKKSVYSSFVLSIVTEALWKREANKINGMNEKKKLLLKNYTKEELTFCTG